jgi:hypothetical protein
LTRPNIKILEEDSTRFSAQLGPDLLASAIITLYTDSLIASTNRTDLLWLLAHFVDLYQRWSQVSQRHLLLKALYIQLSNLETEVSIRMAVSDTTNREAKSNGEMDLDDPVSRGLQTYVQPKLMSLVDTQGLSWLLKELAM